MSKTLKDINPTPSEASAVVAGRDGFANVHRLTPTYTSRLPRARLTATEAMLAGYHYKMLFYFTERERGLFLEAERPIFSGEAMLAKTKFGVEDGKRRYAKSLLYG